MKRFGCIALAAVTSVFLAVIASECACAGSFAWEAGSRQIQLDPPRYRVAIGFYSHMGFPALCAVKVDSTTSSPGSIPAAVLEASGPDWMTTTFDPGTGSATFGVDPCRTDWFIDTLSVVVDVPNPCFEVDWYTTSETWHHGEVVCFTEQAITPTLKETWGHIKSLYR